jgi:hypothetical protein
MCLRLQWVILCNDHFNAAWAALRQAVWVLAENLGLLATVLWGATLDALVGVVLALATLSVLLIYAASAAEVAGLVQTFAAAL